MHLAKLRRAAAPVAPRLNPFQRHIKVSQLNFRHVILSAKHRETGDQGSASTEPATTTPSVHRRLALLGAAVPCLCGLCGGGGSAAKAAGRNPLYDKYFATAMRYGMEDYEALIRHVKTDLFEELIARFLTRDQSGGSSQSTSGGKKRVLEVGIGTGPNFPFYTAALATIPRHGAATSADLTGLSPELESLPGSGSASDQLDYATPAGAVAHAQARLQLQIVGLDPNSEMLRYAAEAATAMGLLVTSSVSDDTPKSRVSSDGGSTGGSASPSGLEVSLVQGSAEALPFGDDEFDAAVVTLVMCSVPSPVKALTELRRVVRPGGRLLLIEHVAAGEGRPGLRLAQSLLTPLQRALADGCSLNRDTAAAVRGAGWQGKLRSFDLEGLSLLAPHIAGLMA